MGTPTKLEFYSSILKIYQEMSNRLRFPFLKDDLHLNSMRFYSYSYQ
ncbi:hypothetical protein LEP1GSC088_0686 [Leptospira interrogans str. L1207]|nr:hypothetical protein LEP1GSC088_0686 [Leptospira interrogans str. L1207]